MGPLTPPYSNEMEQLFFGVCVALYWEEKGEIFVLYWWYDGVRGLECQLPAQKLSGAGAFES